MKDIHKEDTIFKFTPKNNPKLALFFQSVQPNYLSKTITVSMFDVNNGLVHDWINSYCENTAKEDFKLEIFNSYGEVIVVIDFINCIITNHRFPLIADSEEPIYHYMTLSYEQINRLNWFEID